MSESHIELLPARYLCAVTGLDTSFGRDGVSKVLAGGAVGEVLAVTGFIFVGESVTVAGNTTFDIVRLTSSNGELDLTWGVNGKVAVPFEVDRLVFDRGASALYATEKSPAKESLRIFRLNGTGQLDPDFGPDGQRAYTPGQGSDASVQPRITCESLTVLRDGGVLIGTNVVGSTSSSGTSNGTDPVGYSDSRTYDETLIRLRADGRRDRRFGRRGVAIIASGRENSSSDGYDQSSAYDQPTLRAVTPVDGGAFRVVSTRETGEMATYYGFVPTEVFNVGLQTIDATGQAAADEMTWKIVEGKSKGAFIADDVIDRNGRIEMTNAATDDVLFLSPGKKPLIHAPRYPAGVIANGRVPDRHGGYYVTGVTRETGFDDPVVVKIRRNGQVEDRWADHGVLRLGLLANVSVDTDDRLIATDGLDRIARFDGWPSRYVNLPR